MGVESQETQQGVQEQEQEVIKHPPLLLPIHVQHHLAQRKTKMIVYGVGWLLYSILVIVLVIPNNLAESKLDTSLIVQLLVFGYFLYSIGVTSIILLLLSKIQNERFKGYGLTPMMILAEGYFIMYPFMLTDVPYIKTSSWKQVELLHDQDVYWMIISHHNGRMKSLNIPLVAKPQQIVSFVQHCKDTNIRVYVDTTVYEEINRRGVSIVS